MSGGQSSGLSVRASDLASWVGKSVHSSWLRVDQDMINRFADLTGDRAWIHVDVERALRERGGTIAHGFLTLSLMSALTVESLEITDYAEAYNYGFDRVRFTGQVPCGANIRLRTRFSSVQFRSDSLLLHRDCAVEVEHESKPVLVADWLTLLKPAGIVAPSERAD